MLDLATVVFNQELDYLKIHARSIELYVDPGFINNIWIIVNDDTPCNIDTSWYGINSSKVKIINYQELGADLSFDNLHDAGWRTQQLWKLLISNKISSEWYAVLDAKTWFVTNISQDTIFSNNQVRSGNGIIYHWFNNCIEEIKKIYGVELTSMLGPIGVPFVFHTKTTQDMIKETADIVGRPFAEYFLAHSGHPCFLTEFILYSGYVIKKYGSWDPLYLHAGIGNLNGFNICDFEVEPDLLSQKFGYLTTTNPKTVSIHKRAWPLLDSTYQQRWLAFLRDKHLIDHSVTDFTPR